jgi:hypothetical protein
MMKRVDREVAGTAMEQLVDRIAARTTDPYSAADDILGRT